MKMRHLKVLPVLAALPFAGAALAAPPAGRLLAAQSSTSLPASRPTSCTTSCAK